MISSRKIRKILSVLIVLIVLSTTVSSATASPAKRSYGDTEGKLYSLTASESGGIDVEIPSSEVAFKICSSPTLFIKMLERIDKYDKTYHLEFDRSEINTAYEALWHLIPASTKFNFKVYVHGNWRPLQDVVLEINFDADDIILPF
ncbi:MAG: hypothetical protein WC180_03380 [Candidatus Paceibacterota bacterium]